MPRIILPKKMTATLIQIRTSIRAERKTTMCGAIKLSDGSKRQRKELKDVPTNGMCFTLAPFSV